MDTKAERLPLGVELPPLLNPNPRKIVWVGRVGVLAAHARLGVEGRLTTYAALTPRENPREAATPQPPKPPNSLTSLSLPPPPPLLPTPLPPLHLERSFP